MNTDKNCTHLAGEYFVAAELYKRGFSVAITLGNAKSIDMYAEKNTSTVNVQVKAIKSKTSGGWPIQETQIKQNIVYVFVCLNAVSASPQYFICKSEEASKYVKQYKTRGIIQYSNLNSSDYENRWDKLDELLGKL